MDIHIHSLNGGKELIKEVESIHIGLATATPYILVTWIDDKDEFQIKTAALGGLSEVNVFTE